MITHIDIADEATKVRLLCGKRLTKQDNFYSVSLEYIGETSPVAVTCPVCAAIADKVRRGLTLEAAKAEAQP